MIWIRVIPSLIAFLFSFYDPLEFVSCNDVWHKQEALAMQRVKER